MQTFTITGIVHDSTFNRGTVLFCVQINHIINQWVVVSVQKTYKLFHSFVRMEHLFFEVSFFVFLAAVGKRDGDTLVQVSQFAHTCFEDVIFIFGNSEDRLIRPKGLFGTADFCHAYFLNRVQRMSAWIFLLENLTVAEHLCSHVLGQCVHTRYTYTVKTTGYFIRTFIEFTSGMEYRHDDFQCGFLFLFVVVHRNTTAVVLHCDGVVFVDCYFDVVAITGQRFVDRVVNNFINQVVQTLFADISDIHGGTFTYGLQSFKNLDIAGRIIVLAVYLFFFSHV